MEQTIKQPEIKVVIPKPHHDDSYKNVAETNEEKSEVGQEQQKQIVEEANKTVEKTEEANKPKENEEIVSSEREVLQEFTENVDASCWDECISKINVLNTHNDVACLKIGSILNAVDEVCKQTKKGKLKDFFNNRDLKLNKSQGYKYWNAYLFCRDYKNLLQEPGIIKSVGVEKLYLMSKLNNKTNLKELLDLTIKKQLSIRELKFTIKLIEKNISISVDEACENVCSAINTKTLNEKLVEWEIITPKSKIDSEAKIQELQSKIDALEKEIAALKS